MPRHFLIFNDGSSLHYHGCVDAKTLKPVSIPHISIIISNFLILFYSMFHNSRNLLYFDIFWFTAFLKVRVSKFHLKMWSIYSANSLAKNVIMSENRPFVALELLDYRCQFFALKILISRPFRCLSTTFIECEGLCQDTF